MAFSYPESLVYFLRSTLCTNDPNAYHATDPNWFYSNFIIEYIWNVEADHHPSEGRSHPRSGYGIVKGSNWGTKYGNFKHLPVNYVKAGEGFTPGKIAERRQHNLCQNGNRFRDYEKGDSAEAWWMLMRMPTAEQRYVWIDMLAYIRAIYIPVSFKTSEDYPELSTWAMIKFNMGTSRNIWRGANFTAHPVHDTWGLGIWSQHSIGFDMKGLVQLCSIDHRERKQNVYEAKMIRIVQRTEVATTAVVESRSDTYDFNLVNVLNAHTGLSFQYTPGKKGSWFEDFFGNVVQFALGFVPGIGPLLLVAFSLARTAIFNPDNFFHELSLWVPVVKITEQFKRDIQASSTEMKQLMASSTLGAGEDDMEPPDGGESRMSSEAQNEAFKEMVRLLAETANEGRSREGNADAVEDGVEEQVLLSNDPVEEPVPESGESVAGVSE